MSLKYSGWVLAKFFVYFLAMYLQCTGSGHHPLPPVSVDRQDQCQSQRSPSPKMVPYRCVDIVKGDDCLSNILLRGPECSSTPMPGVTLHSPLKDLIPIEGLSSPIQDKGKGRAIEVMSDLDHTLPTNTVYSPFDLRVPWGWRRREKEREQRGKVQENLRD